MSDIRPNRIAEIRKAKQLSQQDLAEAVGAHWITISKLERGKMQLTGDWLNRLAGALDVTPGDILPARRRAADIAIMARFGRAGTVEPLTDVAPARSLAQASSCGQDGFWVEAMGEALWPPFRQGDLIKFVAVNASDLDSHLGRLTYAQTKDGRTLVGVLEKGSRPGAYGIRPRNARSLRELDLKSVAVAAEARFLTSPP
jgi:transcriptional regulator with XRE-family HTH domain